MRFNSKGFRIMLFCFLIFNNFHEASSNLTKNPSTIEMVCRKFIVKFDGFRTFVLAHLIDRFT